MSLATSMQNLMNGGTSIIPSSSMQYLLYNNILYKYTSANGEYIPIYTLSNFSKCDLFNYHNRIVISCANLLSNNNMMGMYNTLSQSIYVILEVDNSIQLLDIISFTASITPNFLNPINIIPIITSPQLTKIYYQYY